MANELRTRANFLSGVLDADPGSAGTTLSGPLLASLPAIGTSQYMPLTLDPGAVGGAPEIVWVTAHTASATTATVLRGQEGTTARAQAVGTRWVHTATVTDVGKTDTQVARDLAQAALTGGGVVTWDGANLKWSARFIAICAGTGGHWSTSGYYDIAMPTTGTVLTGYGGHANVTVATAGIALSAWDALYAIPTIGGINSAVSFGVVAYAGSFVVPSHWILVGVVNNDDGRIRLGSGQILDYWRAVTFQNSWANYGGSFAPAAYRKTSSGLVVLRGLIASGTVASAAFTLPAGYRPAYQLLFAAHAGGGSARVDVFTSGVVAPQAYYASGNNGYVNMDGITFLAEA